MHEKHVTQSGQPSTAMSTSSVETYSQGYQFSERHQRIVRAPALASWRAIKQVRADEIAFFSILMGIRGLFSPKRLSPHDRPLLDEATAIAFTYLAEQEGRELVLGTIGRFWHLTAPNPVRVASAQEFLEFNQPNYAKAVLSFVIDELDANRSCIVTETRIIATDELAAKKFRFYWRFVQPGSALIRKAWLRAIAHRAQSTD